MLTYIGHVLNRRARQNAYNASRAMQRAVLVNRNVANGRGDDRPAHHRTTPHPQSRTGVVWLDPSRTLTLEATLALAPRPARAPPTQHPFTDKATGPSGRE